MTDNPVTVVALVRKRRDIAFEVADLERATEAKRQELIHIDAVIRLFAPELEPENIPERHRKPRRLAYFAHGEISRRCFDMLRSGQTLAAIDLARQAMADKELNFDSERNLRIEFARRITSQLNAMARKGEIEKVGNGRGVRWRLPTIEPERR
jgi:hypothetical protein